MNIFLQFTTRPESTGKVSKSEGHYSSTGALPSPDAVRETAQQIGSELGGAFIGFEPRVAIRFQASDGGLDWDGAVLLERRRSRPSLTTFFEERVLAVNAVEGAVDRAVQTMLTDDAAASDGKEPDLRVPSTRVLGRDKLTLPDQAGVAAEWAHPASRWAMGSAPWHFLTSVVSIVLSAMAFFGFVYLISSR